MKQKNYKFTIQYDGRNFHGWQFQLSSRTVQGEIEKALSSLFPDEVIRLVAAGRTDSGVHAVGQVANIMLPNKMSTSELRSALNGNLDGDLRINIVEVVGKDFSARFSAVSREYEYQICKNYSTIKRNYSACLKYKIEFELLEKCSKKIIGKHDFSSFCKSNSEVKNKLCVIDIAEWEELDDMIIFRIRANRFLHHMVRFLVGTMLEVARKRYSLEEFVNLLENRDNSVNVICAPAQGLFLKNVSYN